MRFARFEELVVEASLLPINEQESFLQREFVAWQGANAQYDDITVMGVILSPDGVLRADGPGLRRGGGR